MKFKVIAAVSVAAPLNAAPGSGWTVRIPLPLEQVSRGMVARFVTG